MATRSEIVSGVSAPVVASYVRVAVGPGARRRLREEERFYRIINDRVVTLCRAVCTQIAIETDSQG